GTQEPHLMHCESLITAQKFVMRTFARGRTSFSLRGCHDWRWGRETKTRVVKLCSILLAAASLLNTAPAISKSPVSAADPIRRRRANDRRVAHDVGLAFGFQAVILSK